MTERLTILPKTMTASLVCVPCTGYAPARIEILGLVGDKRLAFLEREQT